MEATQIAQMVLLPSIMLSGYIFPLSSLPAPLRWLSQILPATHFIAISRGIVIRGASFADLWQPRRRSPGDRRGAGGGERAGVQEDDLLSRRMRPGTSRPVRGLLR